MERLVGSGLIQANFEVHETKIHAPGIELGPDTRMYTANHFIVSLRPDRLALAEYADFAGLRCEIQVVTILNHAWAELEHDIIYKAPELTSKFGQKTLDSINQRLKDIAATYLLPAGSFCNFNEGRSARAAARTVEQGSFDLCGCSDSGPRSDNCQATELRPSADVVHV